MSIGYTFGKHSNIIRLFFLFFLLSLPVLGQGVGTIKGLIVDKETGEPLPAANILVVNTSIGTVADLDGKFILRNIPAGTRSVKVSYLGYTAVVHEITVTENVELEQNFRLTAQALEGETVVITAQARGQNTAINQQLASNTISNIVSSDRIKELPDVSAAESIGRLPGISIDRYNGEATAVAIRGLAPKYNTITVNGVTLPATDNENRTVDLSLISSNLLDGIEVKKANTPDMDADALGGTVDLRLREAPEEFQLNGTAQFGNNHLERSNRNFNTTISLSNRFLDSELGIIVGFNADGNNRSADKLNANYREVGGATDVADGIRVINFVTRRDEAFKNRLGGNLLTDYKIPFGKVTFNGFYSQAKTEGIFRQDNMDFEHHSHYYSLEANESTTSLYTSSGGLTQDFGWIKYDVGFSGTGSKNDDPTHYQWQFAQENNADSGKYPTVKTPLSKAYLFENVNDSGTGLQSVYLNNSKLTENQKVVQVNFQIPFNLIDDVNGYVKFGGKFKWLNRNFDQNSWGHGNLQYGTYWSNVPGRIARAGAVLYPNDFSVIDDSISLNASKGGWLLSRFSKGYSPPSDFLDGQYKFGMSPDLDLMKKVTNVLQTLSSDWQLQPLSTYGRDYDGIERYQAVYIMSEISIGQYITLIPGVRYDADYTKYHGQTFQEVIQAGDARIPTLTANENVRENVFWLPMVHLKIVPFDWLRIHLAGTETVTRPDYSQYAPITTIDQYNSNIQATNASLRDSRSKNLDVSISIYESYAGFITVSGFYKKIEDLIFYQGTPRVDSTIYKLLNADLNVPEAWLKTFPRINTWLNNPTPAQYRGIEFEWQTNFWYLPSVLKGLVFNVNWTYIVSTIDIKQYSGQSKTVAKPPPGRGFDEIFFLDSTSRTHRMPDQPAHIFNTTIGYDIMGFSIRASYLYQSDKITGIGERPLTDAFTGKYARWDLAVQQKVSDKLQLFANFNNLNNRHDESLIGYRQDNPTSLQYYGRTMDFGLRYKL